MLYTYPTELPAQFDRIPIVVIGCISDSPEWQSKLISLIDTNKYDVINPRGPKSSTKTADGVRKQIEWEHRALEYAQIVIFWFPKESKCLGTLFHYGKLLERACKDGIRLIGGCDPGYTHAGELDVRTQLAVDWAADDEVAVDFIDRWDMFTAVVSEEVGK